MENKQRPEAKKSTANDEPESSPIGDYRSWLSSRVLQIFLLLATPTFYLLDQTSRLQLAILAGTALPPALVLLDMVAEGYADARGISFRRYWKRDFVPWEDIRKLEWHQRALILSLQNRPLFRSKLFFPSKRAPWKEELKDALTRPLGSPLPEPAFIKWLKHTVDPRPFEIQQVGTVGSRRGAMYLILFVIAVSVLFSAMIFFALV